MYRFNWGMVNGQLVLTNFVTGQRFCQPEGAPLTPAPYYAPAGAAGSLLACEERSSLRSDAGLTYGARNYGWRVLASRISGWALV